MTMNRNPSIQKPELAVPILLVGLCVQTGFAGESLRLRIENDPNGTLEIQLQGGEGLHQIQQQSKLGDDWLNVGGLTSVRINCALCHSVVDDSFAPGIGNRLDGWPNRD